MKCPKCNLDNPSADLTLSLPDESYIYGSIYMINLLNNSYTISNHLSI